MNRSLNDKQMQRFVDLIYNHTGLRFTERKKSLVTSSLNSRMRVNGLGNYDEYLDLLDSARRKDGHPEWAAFLEAITTHETYFYRHEKQWEWFCESFIPELETQVAAGKRGATVRIWSAASSRGDEAYTAACCLASKLEEPKRWTVEIVGTDIGADTVEAAQNPLYNERSVRNVPGEVKRDLFQEVEKGYWKPNDKLRKWVNFRVHNLLDALCDNAKFDVIFLNNVMIYFDAESKEKVVANLFRSLAKNGYLVLGPAEGVTRYVADRERVKSFLYRNTPALTACGG
ncbi:MAG: CheR family methyltransferase [Planctomycetota bacterium]|nr:CheR family methyltransferase [Planctomycetota bacterium]